MSKDNPNNSTPGNPPPAPSENNPPPAPPPETPKAKQGAKVHLVAANGSHLDAEINRVNKDGTVDLSAMHNGQELIITRSPLDAACKRPDSWHFPEIN